MDKSIHRGDRRRYGPFIIDGDPVAQGRPRFTRSGRVYTPKKTEEALDNVVRVIEEYQKAFGEIDQINFPVRVVMDFVHSRPKRMRKGPQICKPSKPDIDNLQKLILDGISKSNLWTDDNIVVSINASKYYAASGETAYSVFYIFEEYE